MREFIAIDPTNGKFVKLIEGVVGFLDITDGMTQTLADKINHNNGNTERDLEIALGASMFGWDTPLAGQISNGQCV